MTNFDQNWEEAKKNHHSAPPENSTDGGELSPRWEEVDHGWEQHVLVDHVNDKVFRYPRNQNAANKLKDEVAVLSALRGVAFNVGIPMIIEHTPEYTVYKYIPGDVLSEQELASLTDEQATKIGTDLGIFFAILHNCDPDIAERRKYKQAISLFEYYRRRIEKAKKNADFYPHARNLLDGIQPAGQHVLVHGDLHSLNMVIDPLTCELSGVIDFSEVEIGDPHQDFRKIFMADPRFLDPAITSYQRKTNTKLSEDRIKAWAFVNEWANLAFFDGQTSNPTYIRALKHLMQWDEIDQITAG